MLNQDELEKLKTITTKVLEKCGDQGPWDRWARRFLLGIDNSVEAANKALRINDAKYASEFPPEPLKLTLDHEDISSSFSNVWNTHHHPSNQPSYPNFSLPANIPDEEKGPTDSQIKNQYVARSCCCKAVINWGEWTMTKDNDPAKYDLHNEMEVEISMANGALSGI